MGRNDELVGGIFPFIQQNCIVQRTGMKNSDEGTRRLMPSFDVLLDSVKSVRVLVTGVELPNLFPPDVALSPISPRRLFLAYKPLWKQIAGG